MIHSDMWGLFRISNIMGLRWFVTFIDDYTWLTWVFLMKGKFEVGHICQNFNNVIRTQFQAKIHVLKTNKGREYFQSRLGSYL